MYKRLTEDIPVVGVEYADELIDVGAVAAKAMPPGRRYRYSRSHTLILKDGQRVDGQVTGETKPKLAKSIEREQRYIREGCVFASSYQTDTGIHWCTTTKICIGIG